jgi:hypothetical protein
MANRLDDCNGGRELRRIRRSTLRDAGIQQAAERTFMHPVLAPHLGDPLPRGAIPGRPGKRFAHVRARFP